MADAHPSVTRAVPSDAMATVADARGGAGIRIGHANYIIDVVSAQDELKIRRVLELSSATVASFRRVASSNSEGGPVCNLNLTPVLRLSNPVG